MDVDMLYVLNNFYYIMLTSRQNWVFCNFAILQNRDTCDKRLIAVKIKKISSYCVKERATSCLERKYSKFFYIKILNSIKCIHFLLKTINVGQYSFFGTSQNKDISARPSDVLLKNFSNIKACAWMQGFTLIMHNFL